MTERRKCPCCGADAMLYTEQHEQALAGVYNRAGLDVGIGVKLAERWFCECWKRPECQRCKRCLQHCACVGRATTQHPPAKKLTRAEVKKLIAATEPLMFEAPEKRQAKGRGKRK